MNNLAVIEKPQQPPLDKGYKHASIAAILYGKYYALGTVRVIRGTHHSETDYFMATFTNKVPAAQFLTIANSITSAFTDNISLQIYNGADPRLTFPPQIKVEPGQKDESHKIHITLSVEFDGSANNPVEFRQEFGRQVAEVLRQAKDGTLDFGEPKPRFLPARIATAKLARKFIK